MPGFAERIAAHEPAAGKQPAAQDAMAQHGLPGVFRTGGPESATRWQKRGKTILVGRQSQGQYAAHAVACHGVCLPGALAAEVHVSSDLAALADAAALRSKGQSSWLTSCSPMDVTSTPRLGTMTTSSPGPIFSLLQRKNSRIKRLTLLRFTALPIFLLTPAPQREGAADSGRGRAKRMKRLEKQRCPRS